MRTSLLIATVIACSGLLAACAEDDYYGSGYGSARVYGGDYGSGYGDYNAYYDDYYGPYSGGYWGVDGVFYFYDRDNRRYHRDDGGHFRRQATGGFHTVQGRPPPPRQDRPRDRPRNDDRSNWRD